MHPITAELPAFTYKRGYLKGPGLIVVAFATVFFPRIIDSMGAPSAINFVHFAVVPLVFAITLFKFRPYSKQVSIITQLLLLGLFLLLLSVAASAILNSAGWVNLALGYLLLAEPFLILVAVVFMPMTSDEVAWLRKWILIFGFSNLAIAIAQHFLIQAGLLRVTTMTIEDNVQGVFYLSGAGHVVSASVSMTFGIYYLASAKGIPFWLRATVVAATQYQMLVSDAKQALLVFLGAWAVLIVVKLTDIKVFLQYLAGGVAAYYGFLWALNNVPLFRAFNGWIRPGLYGPDGDATVLKFGGFPIITSYYEHVLHWFLGLGPGHTVGRLGGWILKDYANLLFPLGATHHPASEAVGKLWGDSYLNSSFFSPLFGWIGIWGDFGILGLGIYLFLWWVVWQYLCQDDFARFTVITVFIFGAIFTQMEEPGYMLTVTMLLGLRWRETQLSRLLPTSHFKLHWLIAPVSTVTKATSDRSIHLQRNRKNT